jgi:hypothetical protein
MSNFTFTQGITATNTCVLIDGKELFIHKGHFSQIGDNGFTVCGSPAEVDFEGARITASKIRFKDGEMDVQGEPETRF